MSKKIKVMAYGDAPPCATGFATVNRNIFEALHRTGRYEISMLGINYHGDPHDFPYRIWPAATNKERDPYGRQKAIDIIPSMDFDILFFLQDTFILNFIPTLIDHLKKNYNKPFKSIGYYPTDSIIKPQWAQNINPLDKLVSYTEFGKQEFLKRIPDRKGIEVIPHGANIRDFYPSKDEKTEEFKKQYFGQHADKFIITNLNRNQQRKDIPRTIKAFKKFKELVPESILYLHMAKQDQGWNLPEVCAVEGLSTTTDVIFPENFGPNQGYPMELVNTLYNCSDVVVSTTIGEGFGLSWPEAMATKTPVLMPNNTAMAEFITEDMGYLIDSGTSDSLWSVLPNDNEVQRPLVDVDDMVDKLFYIYNNREEAAKKADKAYDWIINEMDWQGPIAKMWVDVFDRAYEESQKVDPVVFEKSNTDGNIIEAEEF